ncbi:MAG: hypothetical protein ING51_10565 [Rhodocyclaceae bacterium]|nr:hypothetical protein [Rhodocyclaceae bacterium]MCA3052686.1 hypothetical protein [Rhodocyclaceae bacterium]
MTSPPTIRMHANLRSCSNAAETSAHLPSSKWIMYQLSASSMRVTEAL